MSKVILVTGAARGLGKTICQCLAREGHNVYGTTSSLSTANMSDFSWPMLQMDLCKEQEIQNVSDFIANKHGQLDALINNAGIAYLDPIEKISSEETKNLFQINFFGPLRLTQNLLPIFRNQKAGKIIFISSIRGIESHGCMGIYSASKAALESAAFDLAVTLSPWDVSVSVIQPGPIYPGMNILHGSANGTDLSQYPICPPIKLNWESPDGVTDLINKILEAKSPHFAYQSSDAAYEVIKKHLKDPSLDTWLKEQQNWYKSQVALA